METLKNAYRACSLLQGAITVPSNLKAYDNQGWGACFFLVYEVHQIAPKMSDPLAYGLSSPQATLSLSLTGHALTEPSHPHQPL